MRGEDRAKGKGKALQPSQHQHPENRYRGATTSGPELSQGHQLFYHRPPICIIPGEMLFGGLAMRLPVLGLTIGMALVPERIADG